MLTKKKLEEALKEIPLASPPQVQVTGEMRYVATVTSGSFATQNEAERQAQVWGHLRKSLSADELANVEFVFTNAPGEDRSEPET